MLRGAPAQPSTTNRGHNYKVEDLVVESTPVASVGRLHPVLNAGGESEAARAGLAPMRCGMAAYVIVRDRDAEAQRELARITNVQPGSLGFGHYQDRIANTPLDQQVSLQDYAVSNRGLRANLVGTAEPMADRIRSSERAGVDLLLVLCRPQRANMERCAETVIPLVRGRVANAA